MILSLKAPPQLVLRARLTPPEKTVLQAILDLYRDSAQWPQFRALHRLLAKELDGELVDVTESLMEKLGGRSTRFEWEHLVQLPARGILLDPRIEETYAVLMRGLPLLKEFYLSAVDKPQVTHQHFLDQGWNSADVWRLYHLLHYQRFWSGMGAAPEAGTWHVDLNPEIVRYAKARTAKELWQWQAQQDKRFARKLRPRRSGGRPDYSARSPAQGHWFDRYLMPFIIGVVANRRNNAKTGNHAIKATLGDLIFSKDERAQRNEILCMALAYNLARLRPFR